MQLFLDRLAAHDVLRLGEVAQHVEVAQPLKLGEQLPALDRLVLAAVSSAGLGVDRVEDQLAQALVRLERAQPVDQLLLDRLCLDDRLFARAVAAAGGALVAAYAGARAARAVHGGAAALAAQ